MKHSLSAATSIALLLCFANCTAQTSNPQQTQTAEIKTADHDVLVKRGQHKAIFAYLKS